MSAGQMVAGRKQKVPQDHAPVRAGPASRKGVRTDRQLKPVQSSTVQAAAFQRALTTEGANKCSEVG